MGEGEAAIIGEQTELCADSGVDGEASAYVAIIAVGEVVPVIYQWQLESFAVVLFVPDTLRTNHKRSRWAILK